MSEHDALAAAVEAVKAQHDAEQRRYLNGEQPASQWRPEAYAKAAVDAYLAASLVAVPEEGERVRMDPADALDRSHYPSCEPGEAPREPWNTLEQVYATATSIVLNKEDDQARLDRIVQLCEAALSSARPAPREDELEKALALCEEAAPFLGAFGMSTTNEERWHRRLARLRDRAALGSVPDKPDNPKPRR